jgi:hypothetical protein
MADWLHKEADVYQNALYHVMKGRRPYVRHSRAQLSTFWEDQ